MRDIPEFNSYFGNLNFDRRKYIVCHVCPRLPPPSRSAVFVCNGLVGGSSLLQAEGVRVTEIESFSGNDPHIVALSDWWPWRRVGDHERHGWENATNGRRDLTGASADCPANHCYRAGLCYVSEHEFLCYME